MFVFQTVLSEEMQSLVGVMLRMAQVVTNMMNAILPAVDQLQTYLHSIKDLDLESNNEFQQVCSLCYWALRLVLKFFEGLQFYIPICTTNNQF